MREDPPIHFYTNVPSTYSHSQIIADDLQDAVFRFDVDAVVRRVKEAELPESAFISVLVSNSRISGTSYCSYGTTYFYWGNKYSGYRDFCSRSWGSTKSITADLELVLQLIADMESGVVGEDTIVNHDPYWRNPDKRGLFYLFTKLGI